MSHDAFVVLPGILWDYILTEFLNVSTIAVLVWFAQCNEKKVFFFLSQI